MKLREISSFLDNAFPLSFQEDYDNSGLQTGDPASDITGALLTLDVTPAVIDEAIETGCNLVISHHPVYFKPLKRITPGTVAGEITLKAIKNGISIYSAHTNLDSVPGGVSIRLADVLGLTACRPLLPAKGKLLKLVTFVPLSHADAVRSALFEAGAGVIGNYDSCSYNLRGQGTFRAGENTNPFTGKKGEMHFEEEERIETIIPVHLQNRVISALKSAHPYEEPAWDLYQLRNEMETAGTGAVGLLQAPMDEIAFLEMVAEKTGCSGLRHSALAGRKIRTVALCGGSGGFLVGEAIKAGADAFVTGDLKYHDYTDYGSSILLADAGHYETEKISAGIIYDLIIKKFPTFAVRFSEKNTNPINYL